VDRAAWAINNVGGPFPSRILPKKEIREPPATAKSMPKCSGQEDLVSGSTKAVLEKLFRGTRGQGEKKKCPKKGDRQGGARR